MIKQLLASVLDTQFPNSIKRRRTLDAAATPSELRGVVTSELTVSPGTGLKANKGWDCFFSLGK